jgi:ribosome-binding protein aMBF1 (putative translation factor)
MSSKKNTNIIKEVRAKYNLSYADLAKITGAKESTLTKCSSSGEISEIIRKPIELYIKNRELQEELHGLQYLKTALKRFLDLK